MKPTLNMCMLPRSVPVLGFHLQLSSGLCQSYIVYTGTV